MKNIFKINIKFFSVKKEKGGGGEGEKDKKKGGRERGGEKK